MEASSDVKTLPISFDQVKGSSCGIIRSYKITDDRFVFGRKSGSRAFKLVPVDSRSCQHGAVDRRDVAFEGEMKLSFWRVSEYPESIQPPIDDGESDPWIVFRTIILR